MLALLANVDGLEAVAASAEDQAGEWDVIVELGVGDHDTRARRRESLTVGAVALLADADRLACDHLVLVSSAMVYGAMANNPVPLTEEAVLRPDPDFVFARQLASVEQLVEEWRRSDTRRAVTVLRPVVTVAADDTSSLARALAAGKGHRFAETDPGSQFVHLDDVASAVVRAVTDRLDGVYNVAPDGWIPGERVLALTGDRFKVPLPDRLAEVVDNLRWRFQRGPIPPGLRAYTREPWLVANDKLKETGWQPTVTNEQAYVEGTEAPWYTMVTPKRRQELSLGALAVGLAVGGAVALSLLVRWRRRTTRRRR